MKKVSYLLIACFAVLLFGTSAKMVSSDEKSSAKIIKIKNTTNFDIDEIYLSEVGDDNWGDDILDSDEILEPGEVVEVEIDCANWDVKLVAEDESTCEIMDVNICASAQWNIVADCN